MRIAAMADLQYRFNQNMRKLGAPAVLLAVSGGADSMTMAEMAAACPYIGRLAVAHCNFSLRAHESDGDEALVKEWSERHRLPFYRIRFDTVGYARGRSLSVEMAARELRYDWFGKLLDSEGFDYVAVAHNMNDNAETLVLNLLRGTGVKGASGMKALSGRVLRPMLMFSRQEIEAFAAAKKVPYRNDSTNFSSEYKRNRIRNEVFPIFGKINPSFLKTLVSDMGYFSEVSDFVDSYIESLGEGPSVDISALERSGIPSYALFRVAERYGFGSAQCRDIERAAYGGGTGKHFISSSHFALVDRGRLLFYPLDQVPASVGGKAIQEDVIVTEDELRSQDSPLCVRFYSSRVCLDVRPSADIGDFADGKLYLDAGKISFPLRLRQWRASDRMRPFGMKGWRKLSDIFSDAKLTIVEKASVPVVEDASGAVLAVAGLRSSEDFRVSASSSEVAVISLRDPA